LALLNAADPSGMARTAVDEFLRWESPANHDESRVDDPDAVDVTRSPNNHIAFGGAQHFCIGNQLALLEGEVVFREIGRRIGSIELTGEAPRRPNFQFRSFLSLPVKAGVR
jgi:cytochrome P450